LAFLDLSEDDRCDNIMGHPKYLALPCFGISVFEHIKTTTILICG
jgi:hypothetical protein